MSIADKITRLSTAKTNIANAITNKGGTVTSGDGFEDFATDIGTIPTSSYSGNAVQGDVLSGKTFYSSSSTLQTGTMTNRGAVSASVGYNQSYTIPQGYHNGSGSVSCSVAAGTITNNTSGGASSGTINAGNQIKIGAGYYPSDTYYTAEENSGSTPVLLWTNPRPTSSFSSQNVSVSMAYSHYIIECYYSTTDGLSRHCESVIAARSDSLSGNHTIYGGTGKTSSTCYYRVFAFGVNRISFYDEAGLQNNYIVPYRIWGINLSL